MDMFALREKNTPHGTFTVMHYAARQEEKKNIIKLFPMLRFRAMSGPFFVTACRDTENQRFALSPPFLRYESAGRGRWEKKSK
jgi:hypothetical protein